ncbi:MAG: hypothetical protein M9951_06140 [Burkholderiaceae bacterium]|nr:hypothetical protein [Burkholderiaceae bacterium]
MRRIVLAAAIVMASGCATSNSIYRPLALHGNAVSIDAKQRVVVTRTDKEEARLCAEPSPDALSAYSSSFGGTFDAEDKAQMQLALTRAEQAAAIGLRTQSIQLLRDAMYRTCEAYLSGAITEGQSYQLLRRFQNLMLGLLAIEQLTGAVKAQPAILTTTGFAATGASVEAETKALTAARKERVKAKEEFEAEQKKLETLEKKLETDQADYNTKSDAHRQIKEPTAEDNQRLKDAKEARDKTRNEHNDQKDVVMSKKELLNIADDAVKNAQQNLDDARGQARAFAAGGGAFGSGGRPSAALAESVATQVAGIVANVLREGGLGESCIAAVEPAARKGNVGEVKELLGACKALQDSQMAITQAETGLAHTKLQILQSQIQLQNAPLQPK